MLKRGRHGVIVRFDEECAQDVRDDVDDAGTWASSAAIEFEELGVTDQPFLAALTASEAARAPRLDQPAPLVAPTVSSSSLM